MLDSPHLGVTDEHVSHVLEHWRLRGIRTSANGRQSWGYLAFVPGLEEMVRVAVSLDDELVISAFQDRTATRHWNNGNRDYFVRTYQNMEERDAN
jgi:hypothetical protein